jgi:hypothetical protein
MDGQQILDTAALALWLAAAVAIVNYGTARQLKKRGRK